MCLNYVTSFKKTEVKWWEDSESFEHLESVKRLGVIESTHEGKACMSDIPADLDSR